MGNSTFSGPVRSEGGFTSVSKSTSTGAFTTQASISSAGFASLDANTLATEAGTGITTGSGTIYRSAVIRHGGIITTNDSEIVHDNLSGFVANEHIDHSGVSITAGAGSTAIWGRRATR